MQQRTNGPSTQRSSLTVSTMNKQKEQNATTSKIPKFLIQPQSQIPLHKTFDLYHLRNCIYYESQKGFRSLVQHINSFNKKLTGTKSHSEMQNFIKKYYLHKNLYNQLQVLIILKNLQSIKLVACSVSQVQRQTKMIENWYSQQQKGIIGNAEGGKSFSTSSASASISKYLLDIRNTEILPKIKTKSQQRRDIQNLTKILSDISDRRQSLAYKVLPRSFHSKHFKPQRLRIDDYKLQQQERNECQQQPFSQQRQLRTFKSCSLFPETTQYTTVMDSENRETAFNNNFQNPVNKSKKSNVNSKTVSSAFFNNKQSKNYKQFNNLTSHKSQSQQLMGKSKDKYDPFSLNRYKKIGNFHLMDDLLSKDNQILDTEDNSRHIDDLLNEDQQTVKDPHFTATAQKKYCAQAIAHQQFNCSKVSLARNPNKHSFVKKMRVTQAGKDEVDTQDEKDNLIKLKLSKSIFKTNQNRKSQMSRFLSSISSSKFQNNQHLPNKNLVYLNSLTAGQKILKTSTNSNLMPNLDTTTKPCDIDGQIKQTLSKKLVQFQDSIKKNTLKQAAIKYSKYMTTQIKSPVVYKEQQSNDYDSQDDDRQNLLKKSFSKNSQEQHQNRLRKSTSSYSNGPGTISTTISTTNLANHRNCISSILEKNSSSIYNEENAEKALTYKLKLVAHQLYGSKPAIKQGTIRKALSVYGNDTDGLENMNIKSRIQSIGQPKISNPFFKVQKSAKRSKSKA